MFGHLQGDNKPDYIFALIIPFACRSILRGGEERAHPFRILKKESYT